MNDDPAIEAYNDTARRIMHHQTMGGFPESTLQENEEKALTALRAAALSLADARLAAMLRELSWEGPDESPEWFQEAIKTRLAAIPSEEAKPAAEGGE